jgi:hypothetical protein
VGKMSQTILCNLSDANKIIEESRQEWISEILESLNVDEEIINGDIRKYRQKMEEIGVDVILYSNGEVDVFKKVWFEDGFNQGWLPAKEENLIAQWKMPVRVKRIEEKEVYYEIYLNEWRAF